MVAAMSTLMVKLVNDNRKQVISVARIAKILYNIIKWEEDNILLKSRVALFFTKAQIMGIYRERGEGRIVGYKACDFIYWLRRLFVDIHQSLHR